jgi:hypothetical protein
MADTSSGDGMIRHPIDKRGDFLALNLHRLQIVGLHPVLHAPLK